MLPRSDAAPSRKSARHPLHRHQTDPQRQQRWRQVSSNIGALGGKQSVPEKDLPRSATTSWPKPTPSGSRHVNLVSSCGSTREAAMRNTASADAEAGSSCKQTSGWDSRSWRRRRRPCRRDRPRWPTRWYRLPREAQTPRNRIRGNESRRAAAGTMRMESQNLRTEVEADDRDAQRLAQRLQIHHHKSAKDPHSTTERERQPARVTKHRAGDATGPFHPWGSWWRRCTGCSRCCRRTALRSHTEMRTRIST